MRCSHSTATKALEKLEKAGLIRKEYQKNGLPLKIYVNDIRIVDNDIASDCSEKPQDKLLEKQYSLIRLAMKKLIQNILKEMSGRVALMMTNRLHRCR